MGFCELLTIIFILLKVFEFIEWSWWLVFMPEIIAGVFYIVIIACQIVMHIKAYKINKQINEEFEKLSKKGW